MDLKATFRNTLTQLLATARVVTTTPKIVAAVSGGPDSVAMLGLLVDWRNAGNGDVIAAHFNHRLRPEADEEEKGVKNLCRSLGVELHVGSADVEGHARRGKRAIHAVARDLRYH